MPELYADKCARCETYFLTTDVAALRARLLNHERSAHGSVDPSRPDRGDDRR